MICSVVCRVFFMDGFSGFPGKPSHSQWASSRGPNQGCILRVRLSGWGEMPVERLNIVFFGKNSRLQASLAQYLPTAR